MNNDIKIDWKKYVDQIYSIRYTKDSEYRKQRFNEEIKRVDILDSDIYYEFENIDTIIYKDIYNNCIKDNVKEDYSYAVDCSFGHYYCMKHAQQHNYNKILILESDCIFLKNKEYIIKLLDKTLEINDDKFLFVLNAVDAESPPQSFLLPDEFTIDISKNKNVYGAAFNIYSKYAYEYFIKRFENFEFKNPDNYAKIYGDNVNIYINAVNICIQQNWTNFTVNFEKLYNVNIKEDLINVYKYHKLELLSSFLSNYHNLQFTHEYHIDDKDENTYYIYYMELFKNINKYFFDNKLNIDLFNYDYTPN